MQKLWEKSLDFKYYLLINLQKLFVGNVFKLHSLHVHYDFQLINSHLITVDNFFAFLEFHAPGVLKFFYEVMHYNISTIVQNTHQLHELNLSDLNDKYWSPLFISIVESIGE